jgi:hypothetical protein
MTAMNQRFILSNLKEAGEELQKLIQEMESRPDFSFEDFHCAMAHMYHHLNSAWNGRYVTNNEWRECTDENFEKWQKFPQDLPLMGDDTYYDLPEYNKPPSENV